jgi:hypothetical protein
VEPKKGTKWPKTLPRFENRQDAIAVLKELCKLQFILRCEKRGKGELGVSNNSSFCDVVVKVKHLLLTFSLDDANA